MSEYNRYLLTYPHTGNKIYKSKSLKKVIKRCYNEFKQLNDIDEGLFAVTNIDKNEEYKFKAQNKRIIKMHGGKSLTGDSETDALMRVQTSLNDHSKVGLDIKEFLKGRIDHVGYIVQENNDILKNVDKKLNHLLAQKTTVQVETKQPVQPIRKDCDCDGCTIC